jgi:hypothetical protein
MPGIDERPAAAECGEQFWSLLDSEVLDCLECGRPLSPAEVGAKLGMSAEAAASLLTMLVHDGRVRITAVELVRR